ncbi:hypothetical protein [Streptomyces litmocidini]|uniref:hypothetical protein n=1 Tax=Streptomyces litmocidini TaxID=67318 RepID=UPI00167D6B16|nr:hypothetical protein [Streptomyces litmocidini]
MWTGTLRNGEPASALAEGYRGMRAAWTGPVATHRDGGLLRAGVPADRVARTLIATARGFIAQRALFDDVTAEVLEDGLRGLMSMSVPGSAEAAR